MTLRIYALIGIAIIVLACVCTKNWRALGQFTVSVAAGVVLARVVP